MTLNPTINPSVKGVIFKTGTTPGNTNVMVAYGRYGAGKIAAIGDSSPTDDGTGNPTCSLYNGYYSDASGNHQLLLMNITIWLAGKDSSVSTSTSVSSVAMERTQLSIFPNPSTGTVNLSADNDLANAVLSVCDVTGAEVLHRALPQLTKNGQVSFSLNKGYYFVKVSNDQVVLVTPVVVY